jgi:hypothetical protein
MVFYLELTLPTETIGFQRFYLRRNRSAYLGVNKWRPIMTTTTLSKVERRPFDSLGHADHGWLNARHHFSFASYYDPARMGWGAIRVWNDDQIAANSGFPPHPHQDMEIITYVRSGAIAHQDSLGNKGRTEAGDVQVMSAGTGVRHAEYNLEPETTTIFQIWIEPSRKGGAPSWGAKPFPKGERSGQFVTLASGFEGDGDAEGWRQRRLCGRRGTPCVFGAGDRGDHDRRRRLWCARRSGTAGRPDGDDHGSRGRRDRSGRLGVKLPSRLREGSGEGLPSATSPGTALP